MVQRSLVGLPNEIVVHILEQLPARDILAVGAVCGRQVEIIYSRLITGLDMSTAEIHYRAVEPASAHRRTRCRGP